MTDNLAALNDNMPEREEFKYSRLYSCQPGTAASTATRYTPWRHRPTIFFGVMFAVLLAEFGIIGILAGLTNLGVISVPTLVITFVAAIGWQIYSKTGSFIFTEQYVKFPAAFTFALRGKCLRGWGELKAIDTGVSLSGYTKLMFTFHDGTIASIPLYRLMPEEANIVRNAVLKWSPLQNDRVKEITAIAEFEREHGFEAGLKAMSAPCANFVLNSYPAVGPSSQINGYTIEGMEAGGNFSRTYKAKSPAGSQVVLRELCITDECRDKEALLKQLMEVAQSTALIEHHSICRLLDSFVEENRFYWVLEKFGNRTLRTLSLDERRGMKKKLHTIIEPVMHLHEMEPPVVHALVTPASFTVERSVVKLSDFGFPYRLWSDATGLLAADLRYFPPEAVHGSATTCGDVYSLGATLSYVVTGVDPDPMTPVPNSRFAAQELLRAAMSIDPRERPDSRELYESMIRLSQPRLIHAGKQ